MNLDEIRGKIDEIDEELLNLFCRRMDLVKGVAEYKIQNGMEVLRPAREEKILAKVKKNAGEGYGGYAEEYFRTLLKVSRDMQQKIIEARAGGGEEGADVRQTPDE